MRSTTAMLLLAALLLTALCALACDTPPDSGGACEDDSGCESGTCAYGVCDGLCPCEEGWECERRTNVLGWPTSSCVKPCQYDAGCPAQWHCNTRCIPASSVDGMILGEGYTCAEPAATGACLPDRPLFGTLVADKTPATDLDVAPITFTVKLVHGGRSAKRAYAWRATLQDAELPVDSTADHATLGPFPQGGTLRIYVTVRNDADQETTIEYAVNVF